MTCFGLLLSILFIPNLNNDINTSGYNKRSTLAAMNFIGVIRQLVYPNVLLSVGLPFRPPTWYWFELLKS
jgi:hypothetical protein